MVTLPTSLGSLGLELERRLRMITDYFLRYARRERSYINGVVSVSRSLKTSLLCRSFTRLGDLMVSLPSLVFHST
jgi:hypothetical protein